MLIEISQVGWNTVKRTRDFFLPGDIRALLVARLDQPADDVKDVVHTASVLGREVAISVLAEMVSGADDIQHVVADAQQSEIWIPHGEGHYLFTHALLRDAAYTMQMRARRQELHRLAMNALEKIYANELKFHYAELAYHAKYAELGSMAQKILYSGWQSRCGVIKIMMQLNTTIVHWHSLQSTTLRISSIS